MSERDKDRPVAVNFHDEIIWVTLADGRIIGNPLVWFSWLRDATPEQRADYRLYGESIYWPDLDEGLDIEAVVTGNWTKPKPIPDYAAERMNQSG